MVVYATLSLNVLSINYSSVRSLSKRNQLAALLIEHNIDIIIGCESHLDSFISSSEILPQNYNIHRKDQSFGGDGVFIRVYDHLNATTEFWLDSNSESIWVKILLSTNHSLYICSFYRPPNNDPSSLNHFNNAIATLFEKESHLTNLNIAGDFDMPDITWIEGYGQVNPSPLYGTAVNCSLLDLASDYHLDQLIHANIQQNHILDLVFCTNPEHISKVKIISGISDHEAVFFCFSSSSLTYQKTKHNIYLYNKGNFDAIKQHIECFQASFLSSNPYNNTFQEN